MAKSSRSDDDLPRKGRAAVEEDDDDQPKQLRKKRKSAAGPVRLVLTIVGCVAGAIALFFVLWWVYSPMGPDNSLYCYFPPETTNLTGYDCGDMLDNHKMEDVHKQIIGAYNRFGSARFGGTGFADKDVAKYMSGVVGDPDEKRGSITVIRFKIRIDTDKFVSAIGGRFTVRNYESKDKKKYYQLESIERVGTGENAHDEKQQDVSFFFPNDRTLVYTTTMRECEEALNRVPGRVVVQGNMRELSNQVDGQFFQAHMGVARLAGPASAFQLGILDADVKNKRPFAVGTANWFGSNGNHFVYGEAVMMSDQSAAKQLFGGMSRAFGKATAQIYQADENAKISGLDNPFEVKANENPAGPGGPGFVPSSGNPTDAKDILEGMNQWVKSAILFRSGRTVVVYGRIPHGTPEQGIFEKFWAAIRAKVMPNTGGFGGFGGPMGPMGAPGMMGPGVGPPGMVGPPR